LTRLEHTILIYDLFMDSAVENLDTFPAPEKSGAKEARVEQLVRAMDGKIHASTKKEYTTDELRSTLEFTIDQGYLKYTENDDRLKWEWKDYLL